MRTFLQRNSILRQLLVQYGHVVIVLSLIEGACHRVAQLMMLRKAGDMELGTSVARFVADAWPIELQFARLFVQQEHIAMQSRVLGRARSHILGQCITAGHIVAGNIDNDPVFELTEFWIRATRCIGISQDQRVVVIWLSWPLNMGLLLHLRRGELHAVLGNKAVLVRDL